MKVGDLVRGAYDKNMYRTGVILRITDHDGQSAIARVFWSTTPMGLSRTGTSWVRNLEKL